MLPFANYYISSEKDISNNNRRKKKRPMTVFRGEDDLTVVKAAAWAWYQRNDGKPIIREFNIPRAPRTPKPSRYKIEATKNMILSENRVLAENRVSKSSLWYTNYAFFDDQETLYSCLLDTYEINNISKKLNSDESNLFVSSSRVFGYNGDEHRNDPKIIKAGPAFGFGDHRKDKRGYNGFVKKVNKRMMWKKMIVMGQGSTVCGRSDDVDLRGYQASRRTVKVAAAAESLVRSTASGKTLSGRR